MALFHLTNLCQKSSNNFSTNIDILWIKLEGISTWIVLAFLHLCTICPQVTHMMSTWSVDIRTIVRFFSFCYNGLINRMEVSKGEILERSNVGRGISSCCRPSARICFYRTTQRRIEKSRHSHRTSQCIIQRRSLSTKNKYVQSHPLL